MLLALDTATTTSAIALYDPAADRLLAEEMWQARRQQTQQTLPAVEALLARLGRGREEIETVAVTTGPGSFTGVRIGISMAKGIGLGLPQRPRLLGLPVLSVTAGPFAALAAACGASVWPLLQAGRGRFNWAVAPADDPLWLPTAGDHRAGKLDALVRALQDAPGPVWLVGELSDSVRKATANLPLVQCVHPVTGLRRGGELARLAAVHLAAESPALARPLEPLYLRPPQ